MVIILESFLLPFTEEECVCTSQGTISADVMYYSKFDQEVNALIKALISRVVAYKNLKIREKSSQYKS